MEAGRRTRAAASLLLTGAIGVVVFLSVLAVQIVRSGERPSTALPEDYLPIALSAFAVLLAMLVGALFVRRVDVRVSRGFAWVAGAVSFLVSWGAWLVVWLGDEQLGAWIYRGLRVPQGIEPFWDLSLILQSVDCASWGFDVYAANNGCLAEPSIYGPGTLWLQWIPFMSESSVPVLGVLMMAISSLVLVLLARWSSGFGQILLLVAAVSAPWTLSLERGNMDAVVLWVAVVSVFLVRRWPRLWSWSTAAALIWIVGTWKYYPFAMGLMLLPVLRLRRGWIVLVGFAVATIAFVVATWSNLMFSSSANSSMLDVREWTVLGRAPVVARMLDTQVGAGGIQPGDLVFFALVGFAVLWGIGFGLLVRRVPVGSSMLGTAGSTMFLVAIVASGFGWAYKATFLLLAVPLLSGYLRAPSRLVVGSSFAALVLTAIVSIVVWNTVLATLAGVVAAGFVFGVSAMLIGRTLLARRSLVTG